MYMCRHILIYACAGRQSAEFSRFQIMWLKIICVVVIASRALAKNDAVLDSLYGLEGRNKVAICVATPSGRWRRCDGALFDPQAIVARAQCLSTAPSTLMVVQRLSTGGSCDLLTAGNTDSYSTRAVWHHVMHPYFDLAIVILNRPYRNLDKLANMTAIQYNLSPHGVFIWMKRYFDACELSRDPQYHFNRISKTLKTNNHQFWYFFVTMFLPSVLFMLFFYYITFYTGTPQKVPYKKMHYSKKVTYV